MLKQLFLVLIILSTSSTFSQITDSLFRFSIAAKDLPFASQLQEYIADGWKDQKEFSDSLFKQMNRYENPDNGTGVLDPAAHWTFSYLVCHTQHGRSLQNQAYGRNLYFVPNDSVSAITTAQILEGFSRDTLFKINPILHTTFNDRDEQNETWYFAQFGDLLLVKLPRNMFYQDDKEDKFLRDDFYHTEEYWYFFRKIN